MQFNDDKIWEPLKPQAFHLCNLNVNSLLTEIDEFRDITNPIKPAVLDSFVMNAKVNINGYSIIRNEETEMVEVLHVLLETICVLIPRIFSQILLNMFFFRNSHSKS